MPDNPTIAELAANQDNLSTLASALGAAGLDETLSDEDATFTVFAPTNSAFANIDADELTDNPELLSEVLEYHVVSGQAIEAGDIEDGQTVETVEGETLAFSVDGGTVQVDKRTFAPRLDITIRNAPSVTSLRRGRGIRGPAGP